MPFTGLTGLTGPLQLLHYYVFVQHTFTYLGIKIDVKSLKLLGNGLILNCVQFHKSSTMS